MPTVVSQLYPQPNVSYDALTGLYTIPRLYNVNLDPEAAIVLVAAALPNGYPETFVIDHRGIKLVTMRDVHRSIDRLAEGYSNVLVTYEGHVTGIINTQLEISAGSEHVTTTQATDLTGAATTPQGIGPNLEGTTRTTPYISLKIVENVGPIAIDWKVPMMLELASCVNEKDWNPVLFSGNLINQRYPQGTWLYAGSQTIENRDQTATVTHTYFSKPANGGQITDAQMHLAKWRHYKETTQSVDLSLAQDGSDLQDRVAREYGPVEIESKIQDQAKIDRPNGFGDLIA